MIKMVNRMYEGLGYNDSNTNFKDRCRSCNSLLDFKFAMSGGSPIKKEKVEQPQEPKDCPPDVEQLGRSSWTLLHSIAARYPETPLNKQQADLKQFIKLFGNFYPCWFCAKDFNEYIELKEPNTTTQDNFGKWLCGAHNEVNKKLGKPEFDCNLWKERWKDGWKDGSCD